MCKNLRIKMVNDILFRILSFSIIMNLSLAKEVCGDAILNAHQFAIFHIFIFIVGDRWLALFSLILTFIEFYMN